MTHTLTLAKTSLLASLTRPDPSPLSRSDLDAFHSSLITATSARCSCLTVQTCKDWIVQNIAPSEKRTEALGNYVFALAGSFDGGQKKDGQKDGVSVRRRQLHLLYVLHDVLHHLNFHDRRDGDDETMRKWFCDAMQVPIEKILRLIALTFHRESTRNSRIRKRVYDLLEIWERDAYFPSTALTTYRDLITSPPPPPPTSTSQTDDTSSRTAKKQEKSLRDAPYILPATHGDPSTPYHELPAGNMLPHITPNSTHPIQPSSLKPLPCHAGPAKAELVTALKKFMGDVERLYAVGDAFTFSPPAIEGEEGHEEGETGVTELGEIVKKDALGDVIWGETYYGWSREFCTRMREEGKKRRAAAAAGTGAGGIGRKRGRSVSLGLSDEEYDRDRGRERYRRRRSRSRSRSRTEESRSYSPPDTRPSLSANRSGYDYSHDRERETRRSHRHHHHHHHHHHRGQTSSPSLSRSRSRSRSPPRHSYHHHHSDQPRSYPPPPPPPPVAAPIPPPPPQQHLPFPPFPIPPQQGYIPPAPPNWTGPWPPPPPPPPPAAAGMGIGMGMPMGMAFPGGIPAPPPPPPQNLAGNGYDMGMQMMMMQGFAGRGQGQQGQGTNQGQGQQGQGQGQQYGDYRRR